MHTRACVWLGVLFVAAVPWRAHAEDGPVLYKTYAEPIDDVSVCAASPDDAPGAVGTVWTMGGTGDYVCNGFFKFRIPELPRGARVEFVDFSLTGGVAVAGDPLLVSVRGASSDWSGDFVTWNNQPRLQSAASGSIAVGDYGRYSWSVESLIRVRSNAEVTLATIGESEGLLARFESIDDFPFGDEEKIAATFPAWQRPKLALWISTRTSRFFQTYCIDCHANDIDPCDADRDKLAGIIPGMLHSYPSSAKEITGCGLAIDPWGTPDGCTELIEPLKSYIWENHCNNADRWAR